jgi:Xaa-Pro aminopeptidase
MATAKSRNVLLYSDTDRSADALYFGGVHVPDPFIALGVKGRRIAVVSQLEFGRVRRDSSFDRVLPLEEWQAKALRAWPGERPTAARVVAVLAKELGARSLTVPEDFAAGLFLELRSLGVRLEVSKGALFPEREVKTAREAALLREGNRCSAAGIAAAEALLRASRPRRGRLFHGGRPLTSERLKVAIETACIERGSSSSWTIAAGGDQACDPHHNGTGPLRSNELIIVDVFPRVAASGYHGDMTRTFLRGRASDAQRDIVAAVRSAQLKALSVIRAGVKGTEVHRQVCEAFRARGFETRQTPRGSVGFFHGTGHGLGLEVHEPPRMGLTGEAALKLGTVVTVEPGLYYPGVGACRIEDVVQVTDGRPRMLSSYPYEWELR